jgi:hypothetical protein
MQSGRRAAGVWLGVLLAAELVGSPAAWAAPLVTFTTTDLGGGLYQYDLTLDNTGGPEPLSGLNILDAYSVFGLTGSSTIGAPAGWSFFAPLPPLVDELNFFSLDSGDDVAMDGDLSGFSFQTTTSPGSIGYAVGVEAIGGMSSSQISLEDAVLVPEPASALLVGAGLAALAAVRRRRA